MTRRQLSMIILMISAPLFYLQIIDHSKLKEQYGSVELDEILFDLRVMDIMELSVP